jgi:hypothetical protein
MAETIRKRQVESAAKKAKVTFKEFDDRLMFEAPSGQVFNCTNETIIKITFESGKKGVAYSVALDMLQGGTREPAAATKKEVKEKTRGANTPTNPELLKVGQVVRIDADRIRTRAIKTIDLDACTITVGKLQGKSNVKVKFEKVVGIVKEPKEKKPKKAKAPKEKKNKGAPSDEDKAVGKKLAELKKEMPATYEEAMKRLDLASVASGKTAQKVIDMMKTIVKEQAEQS